MLRIHQAVQSGSFPNASTLAREIEVATKTIHRDIEFMRDRLNLPIEFNPARNGCFYNGEVSAFPTLQIAEGELFALIVAEKALQQYRVARDCDGISRVNKSFHEICWRS